MTAFDPPFEKLFCEDFNGGFRFKRRVNTFNLSHSKVGNVNINRTSLTFFVFDPADAMYATNMFLELQINLNFAPGQESVNAEWDLN